MNNIVKWAIGSFIALGGVGMVIKWLLSQEAATIDRAMAKLLANPQFKPILIKWRPQIEEALDTLDKEVAKDLDSAKDSAQP